MMKRCYENNGAAIYVGRVATINVHTTVENVNRNVSIGQLLHNNSRSMVVCARSRPKMLTKTYNKEVCQTS